ncbi:MAG: DUF1553 domain-containing protein, partial [Planctomycetes bacterium]|nr:DUF1553 domain-containing protein [Planctomycetota bacterium]
TLGCARCHDHKYDPVPTRDYYRMLSAFTTTVRSEMEIDRDPRGTREALARFEAEHAPLAKALDDFERTELPSRAARWLEGELERPDGAGSAPCWRILEIASATSEGGATFADLDDGSFLAGGKNPDRDAHVLEARTRAAGIAAVRLEALSHPSLIKGGPGRASNGNFALTDLRVTAAPLSGGEAATVKLRSPRATFEQKGLPVDAAIDADGGTAWAVDPEFGKDHAALFDLEGPAGHPGGTLLTFTLKFENNVGHGIARPRLSVWTAPGPAPLDGPAMPDRVAAAFERARSTGERPAGEDWTAIVKWYGRLDPDGRALRSRVEEHLKSRPGPRSQKVLLCSEGVQAIRLHTQGDDFFPETYFLRRGDPAQKEGVASPGFLQVLTSAPETRWQQKPPPGSRTSWRRRALAAWLTDVEHGAGRLLARVISNRLWAHHMGRGIVATPSDFGAQGERPSHPELLDWLSRELIRGGWSTKRIHRLIVTSAAYQQSAATDATKAPADPDGRLFSRRVPRRLEAEAIRDAILAASGLLDLAMFGPGTLDPAQCRRSIYFTVKRSRLTPEMTLFDAPDALQGIGERPATIVAPQALFLLNGPLVREAARSLARRLVPAPAEAAARAAWALALGREPSSEELLDAVSFVREQVAACGAEGEPQGQALETALADLCQVLFGLNELVYVD